MKKLLALLLVSTMLVVSLAACGNGGNGGAAGGDEDFTIVMVAKHEGISWFDDMRVGVDEFAEIHGINAYQIAPEGGDPARQAQMVEELIAQGVDAIVVVPNDTQSIAPVLQRARDEGIVVIGHEAPDILDSVDYNMEAFDNVEHGRRFGMYLAEAMGGEGQFASFVGALTMTPHMIWWSSAVDYINENHPNMELITPEPIEDWNDNQLAFDRAMEILMAHPEVMGFTNSAASGAGIAEALVSVGRSDIALVSTAIPSMSGQYILDGYMDAGLLWRPADAGYVSMMIALKVLRGESIETGTNLGRPGYESVIVDGNMVLGDAPLVLSPENVLDFDF